MDLDKLLYRTENFVNSGKIAKSFYQLYKNLYKAMGCSDGLLKFTSEEKPIGYDFSFGALMPPCAVPFWNHYSSITICAWINCFSDKKNNFVKFYSEEKMALELARTQKQFKYIIMLNIFELHEEINDEVKRIADLFEINDLENVFSLWESNGDLPSIYNDHDAFLGKLPQSCFDDSMGEYNGEFFNSNKSPLNLNYVCSFELHSRFKKGVPNLDIRDEVKKLKETPKWLKEGDQLENFEFFFEQKKFQKAWITLCSTGWKYDDAKQAMIKLSESTDDLFFKILTLCWTNQPISGSANY